MTLTFLQFNNYYNRILKRHETVNEYLANAVEVITIPDTDFNTNDGVTTTKIVNLEFGLYPDYLIAIDGGIITSRWYVMDCRRVRKGQYSITLQRDLVADYYDKVASAPIFLEKGYANINNDLIFNAENMTFSQIKRSEILLKDTTGISWIVGYYARPDENEAEETVFTFNTVSPNPSVIVTNLSDWEYNKYRKLNQVIRSAQYQINMGGHGKFTDNGFLPERKSITFDNSSFLVESNFGEVVPSNYNGYVFTSRANAGVELSSQMNKAVRSGRVNQLTSAIGSTLENIVVDSKYLEVKNLQGTIIYERSTEKFYTVKILEETSNTEFEAVPSNSNLQIAFNDFINDLNNPNPLIIGTPNNTFEAAQWQNQKFKYSTTQFVLYLDVIDIDSLTLKVKNTRKLLKDAPYCMFCLPYLNPNREATIDIINPDNVSTSSSPSLGLDAAVGIMLKQGLCYDVQILPYCPIASIRNAGEIDLRMLRKDIDYSLIYDNDVPIYSQVVLWCDESSGSFNIPYSYTLSRDPVEFKVESLAYMHRLCSPNYSSIFEFNACKNDGIEYFNVDYTYKPFSPYIHVNPNFKRLYGQDFNDPRGLIVSGDFSITSIADQWQTYELQNKNYQQMFNRGVENMEVNRNLQRWQTGVGSVTGAGPGIAGGAAIGSMIVPGAGTIVGGILGGALSAGGGAADWATQEVQYQEELDYKRDLYGMQLDNIKALPHTLTKVSALNANNKLFPILEFYVCTNEEEIALRNKLKYNGMTMGVIYEHFEDAIIGPEQWYYKGTLIRLTDIDDDFHVLNSLAAELNKGVFI